MTSGLNIYTVDGDQLFENEIGSHNKKMILARRHIDTGHVS